MIEVQISRNDLDVKESELDALLFVSNILKAHNFKWVITGEFAYIFHHNTRFIGWVDEWIMIDLIIQNSNVLEFNSLFISYRKSADMGMTFWDSYNRFFGQFEVNGIEMDVWGEEETSKALNNIKFFVIDSVKLPILKAEYLKSEMPFKRK